jgi:hypothetical protein
MADGDVERRVVGKAVAHEPHETDGTPAASGCRCTGAG